MLATRALLPREVRDISSLSKYTQDLLSDTRNSFVGLRSHAVRERRGILEHILSLNAMPHWENRFLARHRFPGNKTVKFSLRPLFGEKMGAQDHEAETADSKALIDLAPETIA